MSFLLLVSGDKQLEICLLEEILISYDEPQRVSSLTQMHVSNLGVHRRSPGGGSQSLRCVKRPLLLWHAAGWCKEGVTVLLCSENLRPQAPFHVNGSHRGHKTSLFLVRGSRWFGPRRSQTGPGQKSQQDVRTSRHGCVSAFFVRPPSAVYGFV